MPTDTERIDFMERLLAKKEYTGKAILRNSTTGRGWRLHETSWEGASDTVRGAIDAEAERLEQQAISDASKGCL